MAIERLLTGNLGAQVKDLMATEDLVLEAFRDLVKDELKNHIRAKVDADEELKAEIKEAVSYYFQAKARSVYAELKYESGVHRVQRIPDTESNGRIHTSAATVAVLPEAEDADINIIDKDLKIDTYRASGAGGQHVNKTESAIRITHLPTGVVVTCQDESSQHKNKDKAMKVLKSRLLDLEVEKINNERSQARKKMVSTGDRSAKIRTYNYPQGRITDHRINLTLYKLEEILNGNISEVIESLKAEDQKIQLEENI